MLSFVVHSLLLGLCQTVASLAISPRDGAIQGGCSPDLSQVVVQLFTTVSIYPVRIDTYFSANTIFNIKGGFTININNGPTSIVTDLTATVTSVSTTTITQGPTQTPSVADGELFILAILPVPALALRRRQSETIGFLNSTGNFGDTCETSVQFRINEGVLTDDLDRIMSTSNGTASEPFIGSSTVGGITTFFSIESSQLTWDNAAFEDGAALFCTTPARNIVAVFDGMLPDQCSLINLVFQYSSTCPGLAVVSGNAPGTVIIENPTETGAGAWGKLGLDVELSVIYCSKKLAL